MDKMGSVPGATDLLVARPFPSCLQEMSSPLACGSARLAGSESAREGLRAAAQTV